MSQLLQALDCSFSNKRNIRDCLRSRKHVVSKLIVQALKDCSPNRNMLTIAKSTLMATRISPIKTQRHSMPLVEALAHLEVVKRFLFCLMDYQEVKEPLEEEEYDEENVGVVVVPSKCSDPGIIETTRQLIQSMVGVACFLAEEEQDNDDNDMDINEVYNLPLHSNECKGKRLCYFLMGCLVQLDRAYVSTRVWLLEPIWKSITDELLPSSSQPLPVAVTRTAMDALCAHMRAGIQSQATQTPFGSKILSFCLARLKHFHTTATIPPTVLSTLVHLRGSLAMESSLAPDINPLVPPTQLMELDGPEDADPQLWFLGKAHILLDIANEESTRNQCTDAIVEEIVLRVLPSAFTFTDESIDRGLLLFHCLGRLSMFPIEPAQWISILSASLHPMSVELCLQILSSSTPGLLLAADLCLDTRTEPRLVSRLSRLLMIGDQQLPEVRTRLRSRFEALCQRKQSVISKTFLATIAPVLLCHRIESDAANNMLPPPLDSLCHILRRPSYSMENPSTPFHLVLCLHAAIWVARHQTSDLRTRWNTYYSPLIRKATEYLDKNKVRLLLIRFLRAVGPSIPDDGRLKDIANSFQKLFKVNDGHVHAMAMTSLVEFALTISVVQKKILRKCMPQHMNPLLQCRLEGKLPEQQPSRDLVELRQLAMEQLLAKGLPSRCSTTKTTFDQGSYFLPMKTPGGKQCWVIFPPGKESLEHIEIMKGEEETDILRLERVNGWGKSGCRVFLGRVPP